MTIRLVIAALAAAMLTGCVNSSRFDSYASTSAVQNELPATQQPLAVSLNTEAAPGRWSVNCLQVGTKRVCSPVVSLEDRDKAWLQVGAINGALGALTLGFSVPLGAKEFGAVFVQSDNGVESVLKLRRCTASNCYATWELSRQQKDELLSGRSLEIDYALNSGVNKKFFLPLGELRSRIAMLGQTG